MNELNTSFSYEARYYKQGEINSDTKEVWFVLHGYGQLAQYFIRKFQIISSLGIVIVAPEGLSRYYLQGDQGRVGASWMTRENRLTDIRNYISFLNKVYEEEIRSVVHAKITILGFSQGAATATRWVMDGKIKFDRLILWAGLFAPDIDFVKGYELLKEKEIWQVYGNKDPYLQEKQVKEMHDLILQLNIKPGIKVFNGDHELNEQILLELIS